jgi:hypothetical protein
MASHPMATKTIYSISTKDLQKARRNAERKRASVACAYCKTGKTKCSDYRPCKKCKESNMTSECVDGGLSIRQSTDILSNTASFDVNFHERTIEYRPSVHSMMHNRFSSDRECIASDFRLGQAFGINLSDSYSAGSLTSWPASGATSGYPAAGSGTLKNTVSGELSQEPKLSNRPMLGPSVFTFTGLLTNSAHTPSAHTESLPCNAPGFLQMNRSSPEPSHLLSQQMRYIGDPQLGTTPAFPPMSPICLPLVPLSAAPQTPLPSAVAALNFGYAKAASPHPTAPSIDASLLLALRATIAAPHPHRLAPSSLPLPFLHR